MESQLTFGALRTSSLRSRSGAIRVTYVAGNDHDRPAVAYAISRKVGGAVVRNRIRRRLRCIVQELSSDMPAGAYLVGVSPQARLLSYQQLKNDLGAALAGISHRKNQ